MQSFDEMGDKELFENLEKAGLVDKLENDPAWKMLKEAASRIIERAITEFALKTEAKDIEKIIMLQTIIKKYKYGLFDEVKFLKNESDALFQEAKQRGAIGDMFHGIKNKM